jgi:hypothetical protein
MNVASDLVSNHFAKLLECDTPSRRFGSTAHNAEKRCEDAPHSQSTSCQNNKTLG